MPDVEGPSTRLLRYPSSLGVGRGLIAVLSGIVLLLACSLSPALGQPGRRSFCALDINTNLSTWCRLQCADDAGVLYLFDMRPFLEYNDTFSEFYGNDGSQYRWDPCTPLNVEGSPFCSDTLESPGVCKYDVQDQFKSIGQLPPSEIILHTHDKSDGLAYTYVYNESEVVSTFDFFCKNGDVPGTINEDSEKHIPQTEYHFVVESQYACATAVTPTRPRAPPKSTPLSVGAIAGIATGGLFLLYFLSGMAYKRFGKGATGFEVIPNISFWSSLWSSIKLGALWIASPCVKKKYTQRLRYQKL